MKSEKICYKSAEGQWAMGNGQWASDRYLYVANIYGFHMRTQDSPTRFKNYGIYNSTPEYYCG